MQETRKLQVHYPLDRVNEPVMTRLVTRFDLSPNLVRADIDAQKGGWIVLVLEGEPARLDSVVEWMREQAAESLTHAQQAGEMITFLGEYPSLAIGPLLDNHQTDIDAVMRESLETEAKALALYR